MACYAMKMQRTASLSLAIGSVRADATRPRRGKIVEIMFGCEATPADLTFIWTLDRQSTAPTAGSSVTPAPIDPADAATEADGNEAPTVNGTIGTRLYLCTINQRATYRWVTSPGREFVYPATADNGLAIQTPTGPLVTVSAEFIFDEQ